MEATYFINILLYSYMVLAYQISLLFYIFLNYCSQESFLDLVRVVPLGHDMSGVYAPTGT